MNVFAYTADNHFLTAQKKSRIKKQDRQLISGALIFDPAHFVVNSLQQFFSNTNSTHLTSSCR
jgi:hypothetical protein